MRFVKPDRRSLHMEGDDAFAQQAVGGGGGGGGHARGAVHVQCVVITLAPQLLDAVALSLPRNVSAGHGA
jgi:hypothetical protein